MDETQSSFGDSSESSESKSINNAARWIEVKSEKRTAKMAKIGFFTVSLMFVILIAFVHGKGGGKVKVKRTDLTEDSHIWDILDALDACPEGTESMFLSVIA